jgi:hypothetical protein
MVAITSLSEADQAQFLKQIAPAETLIRGCVNANILKILEAYQFLASTPEIAIKYIKFHHYALVSATVDTIAVLAASDFSIDKDDLFKGVMDNIKARFSINSFNSTIAEFPLSPMHGQDILLFRALENASLNSEVSFFGYKQLRLQLGDALFHDIIDAVENEQAAAKILRAPHLFGSLFSDLDRLRSVDLSFSKIAAECAGEAQTKFISAFESFMNSLPSNVYHCHDGKTKYSNKGFSLHCACGNEHLIEQCEAICDGGYAHYAVFRSPCKTTISKVISEGLFRLKGIKTVSTVTADKVLIDCVEQAVASRKRID